MSEKITFQELIESIADKTDNSKNFTRDFLKDFASVINDGLQEDGKVNIAGFGKFDLKKLDERKGYNPQTGESMTIPAHNKVVFKPYKDLRELVNAPYIDMEPEIIEEETTGEDTKTDEQDENKFIPTGPPPTVENEDPDDVGDELFSDESKKINPSTTSSTFMFDEEDESEVSDSDSDEYDHDVVEYKPEEESGWNKPVTPDSGITGDANETDEDSEVNRNTAPTIEDSTDSRKDFLDEEDEPVLMQEDPAAFSTAEFYKSQDESADDNKDSEPAEPGIRQPSFHTGKKSRFPVYLAAAVILLLLIAGSGYMLMQNSQPGESNSSAETAITAMTEQDQNAEQSSQQQDDEAQLTGQSQQANRQQTSSSAGSKTVDLEIDEGQTLWGMAQNQYDNPYLWPWIYDANKSEIDNPDLIIAGQSITIPMPSGVQNSLTSGDSLEVAIGYVETYKWYKSNGRDNAKLYLWVAANYNKDVLDKTDIDVDKDDLAFANRSQVQ